MKTNRRGDFSRPVKKKIDFLFCINNEQVSNKSVVTEVTLDKRFNIFKRTDKIVNLSDKTIEIKNPAIRFKIYGKNISLHTMSNRWCNESQMIHNEINSKPIVIGSIGRTCVNYAPYFFVSSDSFEDIVFNVLPYGDWRVVFRKEKNSIIIDIDRFQKNMIISIKPGETFNLNMDCLMQMSNKKGFSNVMHYLHRYANEKILKRKNKELPVVYNTWYDRYNKLSISHLKDELRVAKEIGCEVFVIDAGWYGNSGIDWSSAVGDWTENKSVFSETTISEFADFVRSNGLGFGIWMDPERINKNTPVYKQHSDWFIKRNSDDFFYPDLLKPEARNWIFLEISRIIETYQLKWLKIDCNGDYTVDPYNMGHHLQMKEWYKIVDELTGEFPDLIIEGCAGGGLRNDLLTTGHFHTHFVTDSVDPIDIIRVTMSSLCRLSPRMIGKWATINPTGNAFTVEGNEPLDTSDLVFCVDVVSKTKYISYHLDLVMRAAMTGVMGISGNITGFNNNMKEQITKHISFYKKHREFICSSVAIPLTDIEPLSKRDGIAIVQLSSSDFKNNMIFIYNLFLPPYKNNNIKIKLVNLDVNTIFDIMDENEVVIKRIKGRELMRKGFEVECLPGHSRVIICSKSLLGTRDLNR